MHGPINIRFTYTDVYVRVHACVYVHESAKSLGLIFNALFRNVGSSNIISLDTVISILLVAS